MSLESVFRSVAARRRGWALLGWLLYPLGALYGLCGHIRRRLWLGGMLPRTRLSVPVVSIGNLEVGGTGKTPITAWLAGRLAARGLRVAVVARDLNRRSGEPFNASKQCRASGSKAPSDEVMLLAQMLPECTVYAGPDKTGAAARAVMEQSPDVVLVDDGFQHLKLIRDIDIVVLDFDHPFGTGGVLPAGTLREFPNALRHADYYWVSRMEPGRSGEWMTRALSLFNWRAPIVTSRMMPGRLELMGGGSVDPAGLKVLAFCGIGSPEGFRRTLGLAGCEVLDMVRFPDHYGYRPEELAMLEERRRIMKADFLVTTQKDSVKLGRTGRDMNIGWLVVGLDVQGGHARLLDDIQALVVKRREASS